MKTKSKWLKSTVLKWWYYRLEMITHLRIPFRVNYTYKGYVDIILLLFFCFLFIPFAFFSWSECIQIFGSPDEWVTHNHYFAKLPKFPQAVFVMNFTFDIRSANYVWSMETVMINWNRMVQNHFLNHSVICPKSHLFSCLKQSMYLCFFFLRNVSNTSIPAFKMSSIFLPLTFRHFEWFSIWITHRFCRPTSSVPPVSVCVCVLVSFHFEIFNEWLSWARINCVLKCSFWGRIVNTRHFTHFD